MFFTTYSANERLEVPSTAEKSAHSDRHSTQTLHSKETDDTFHINHSTKKQNACIKKNTKIT